MIKKFGNKFVKQKSKKINQSELDDFFRRFNVSLAKKKKF